ncbi:putative cystathionine gamma-synthase [Mycobacterium kiyosense]|nr:putative cystathionine gamma-synthase [Mycobacterium kiyosense]
MSLSVNERGSNVDNVSWQGFSTKAVHAGFVPDPLTGAVNVPIYASSTFAQDGVGELRGGYQYARAANPTRSALEQNLAALEGGGYARAFGSGMAATDCLLRAVLKPGDHLVLPNDAYGGTFRLIDKIFQRWGVEYSVASISDIDDVRAAVRPTTKLLLIETPTNPLLNIGDIAALAELAHASGAKLAVDNTFASPYLQQPLRLGADAVIHSTTKYIGGHSDVIGGALITGDETLDSEFAFLQNGAGAVPGPFDSFLTLRGVRTLALRMEQHCTNAERLVDMLVAHPKIEKVIYPGLTGHPGHKVAAKQMRRFGGMISVELVGGSEIARNFCSRTRIFTLAASLGGVESLVEYPAAMTHAANTGSELEVPANLVRLSVGIEDAGDLICDIEEALK